MIEIYDQCDLCGIWTDVVSWSNTRIPLCAKCYAHVDLHAPHLRGKFKLDNRAVYHIIKDMKERKNG